MDRIFGLDDDEYVRDLDIVGWSIKQTAEGIAAINDIPVEKAIELITAKITNKEVKLYDRKVNLWVRGKNGDRAEVRTTMPKLIKMIDKGGKLLSPTFTVYDNHAERLSPRTDDIQTGFDARQDYKTLAKKASAVGDSTGVNVNNGNQNSKKTLINSDSGAAVSASTPLHYKTIHPSLTSLCRASTAICTATAERCLGSNKNYFSIDAIEEDILALLSSTDSNAMMNTVTSYNLHIPTHDECIEVMEESRKYYFTSMKPMETIYKLLRSLNPMQRCAYVYTGNLFMLLKMNKEKVRVIFDGILTSYYDDVQIYGVESGKDLDGYQHLLLTKMELWGLDRAQALNRFWSFFGEHRQFFMTFLNTPYHQVHLGNQDTAVRKVVPIGDTDSTFTTVQLFSRMYYDTEILTLDENPLFDVLVYITSAVFWHELRRYTARMGISKEWRDNIEMKSELAMPSLLMTVVAKTYHCYVSNIEGYHYGEDRRKFEMKGKRFHGGALPANIIKPLKQTMEDNLIRVSKGEKVSREDVVSKVIELEQSIINGIANGEDWFDGVNIKPKEEVGERWGSLPPAWGEFWDVMWGDTHGKAPLDTYRAVKVPLILGSNKSILTWIYGLRPGAKELYEKWLRDTGKKPGHALNTIYVPVSSLVEYGIPKEILDNINYPSICHGVLDGWYLYLQSMNIFIDYRSASKKLPIRIMSDFMTDD